MTDLLVVGGGPAGLATALYAARAGLEVTVWEPRGGAVDKACGEGLMPGALAALHDLGVDPPGRRLDGIAYVEDTHRAVTDFRVGPGRGVRRTALHGSLRAAVDRAGVEVVARSARRVVQDEHGVTVDGVRAGHLVAADGLHSALRSELGLEGPARRLRRFGLRQHHHVAPWSDHVEVHWSRRGTPDAEVYVTPVARDVVGIAVLTSTRGSSYAEHLEGFPALRDRLRGSGAASSVRGAGPLWRRSRRRVAGRALLVGDAAGYVDALTGEGIALALAQARAAVVAVTSGDARAYEHEWRRVTLRYRLLTGALVQATRAGALRHALVPAAERAPWAFAAAVDALARPA